jgi:NADH-quinone oxidoreductase subunit K
VIHLVGPVVLAAALAGVGVYGLLVRRNAVLVLIGAELVLNAVNVLLVTASALPAGGLSGLSASGTPAVDPLLSGQVLAVFVVTIAAAEIGLALAVVLLLFRRRATSDLAQVRELGELSPTYTETPGAGDWPEVEEEEPKPEPVPAEDSTSAAHRPESIAAWLATGDDRDERGEP